MHALEKPETSALRINVKTAVNTSRTNVRRIPLIRSQTEFSRTTRGPVLTTQLRCLLTSPLLAPT